MRTALGMAIGLGIGLLLGMGVASYYVHYFATSVESPSRAGMKQSAFSEQFYLCQPDHGRTTQLVIKSEDDVAKTILFPWKTEGDEFVIERTTDLLYSAKNVDPKPSATDSSLELRRVTGDMELTSKFKPEAVTLLASVCDGPVPRQLCASRMEQLGLGDGLVDCMAAQCDRVTTGNNFQGRYRYLCKPTERHF